MHPYATQAPPGAFYYYRHNSNSSATPSFEAWGYRGRETPPYRYEHHPRADNIHGQAKYYTEERSSKKFYRNEGQRSSGNDSSGSENDYFGDRSSETVDNSSYARYSDAQHTQQHSREHAYQLRQNDYRQDAPREGSAHRKVTPDPFRGYLSLPHSTHAVMSSQRYNTPSRASNSTRDRYRERGAAEESRYRWPRDGRGHDATASRHVRTGEGYINSPRESSHKSEASRSVPERTYRRHETSEYGRGVYVSRQSSNDSQDRATMHSRPQAVPARPVNEQSAHRGVRVFPSPIPYAESGIGARTEPNSRGRSVSARGLFREAPSKPRRSNPAGCVPTERPDSAPHEQQFPWHNSRLERDETLSDGWLADNEKTEAETEPRYLFVLSDDEECSTCSSCSDSDCSVAFGSGLAPKRWG